MCGLRLDNLLHCMSGYNRKVMQALTKYPWKLFLLVERPARQHCCLVSDLGWSGISEFWCFPREVRRILT